MEEARNHFLFVEPAPLRKVQHVDAVEFVVLAPLDHTQDRIGHHGIGGLSQQGKLGLDVAHNPSLGQIAPPSKQCLVTDA
jgi:hypothetical protein